MGFRLGPPAGDCILSALFKTARPHPWLNTHTGFHLPPGFEILIRVTMHALFIDCGLVKVAMREMEPVMHLPSHAWNQAQT